MHSPLTPRVSSLCLAAVALAACGPTPDAPSTTGPDVPGIAAAIQTNLPSGDDGVVLENLKVCKDWEAPSATSTDFDVTINNDTGAGGAQTTSTRTLADGDCRVVAQFNSNPVGVSDTDLLRVVETPPAGSELVRIEAVSSIRNGSTTTISVDAGSPTASANDGTGSALDFASATWSATKGDNDAGYRVTFVNRVTPVVSVDGRFTGGGSFFLGDIRFTHGFELRCDASDPRQNLEINWLGNQFHLTQLTSAVCTDDPNIVPRPPRAGLDTYEGEGIGRLNQIDGALIKFVITDAGEPGTGDTMTIEITPPAGHPLGTTPIVVSNFLVKGNHQAHDN